MTRRTKIVLGSALALLSVLALAAVLYLRSESFHRYVLARIIQQIEFVSGGRAELRAYQFNIRALEAELQGLVLHGRETDPARPFFAADTLFVRLKTLS